MEISTRSGGFGLKSFQSTSAGSTDSLLHLLVFDRSDRLVACTCIIYTVDSSHAVSSLVSHRPQPNVSPNTTARVGVLDGLSIVCSIKESGPSYESPPIRLPSWKMPPSQFLGQIALSLIHISIMSLIIMCKII